MARLPMFRVRVDSAVRRRARPVVSPRRGLAVVRRWVAVVDRRVAALADSVRLAALTVGSLLRRGRLVMVSVVGRRVRRVVSLRRDRRLVMVSVVRR
jgi:hypothetical protein